MEYCEKKAKEIVDRLGLSEKTIRVWKTRNSIPDKYSDPEYKMTEELNKVDLFLLKKLSEIISTGMISSTYLAKISGVNPQQLIDALRKKGRISADDLNKVLIQIKKIRLEINNTFESKSRANIKMLITHPALHYYKIVNDRSFAYFFKNQIEKGNPIEKSDIIRLSDYYIRFSIMLNI